MSRLPRRGSTGRRRPPRGRERDDEGRETDHGVPFPGDVLPYEEWTRTRVDLPAEAVPFDWAGIFGRTAPRVLDLGCGNGRFLLASALARPTHDHLGIDIVPPAVHHARRRAGERGLVNARFALGDALPFVARHAPPSSLDEVHVYHPQPYFDADKRSFRMIGPAFLAGVHAALREGGILVLQTDNETYWRYMSATVPLLFEWRVHDGPWPDAPKGRTRREIWAQQHDLAIYRATAAPRKALAPDEVARIIAAMPPPDFTAARPEASGDGD